MAKKRVDVVCAVAIALIPCVCVGQPSKPAPDSSTPYPSLFSSAECESGYRVICDEGDYEGPLRTKLSEASREERKHRELHPTHHCAFYMVYDGWQAYCKTDNTYVGKLHETPQACERDAFKHSLDTIETEPIPDRSASTRTNILNVPGHSTTIQQRHIEVRLKSKQDIPAVVFGDIMFHTGSETLIYLVFGL